MDILLLELCLNSPPHQWVSGLLKPLTGCQNPGLSDSKLVGGHLRGPCQSDHHVFMPTQMDQHLLFCAFSLSCPRSGCREALGHGSQSSSCQQAGQGGSPTPPPEGASRFLTICHCSLLKGNSTSQTLAWRELDHHLPTNEARLCKQREEDGRLSVSQGGGPEVGTPGVSKAPCTCFKGSLHQAGLEPPQVTFDLAAGDPGPEEPLRQLS